MTLHAILPPALRYPTPVARQHNTFTENSMQGVPGLRACSARHRKRALRAPDAV
ncbi:hypothetical protein DB32_004126 [Sandaracinus amylolyticus]|uniref:Uncharacterized protein n=1 Tax=Sandaracinus amylolyticus TaxID=927083 RepID=A0A0F6W4D0_9BACT|nr:hypothetical protein DB32_004126 [Sandaracinus amylolyticus]